MLSREAVAPDRRVLSWRVLGFEVLVQVSHQVPAAGERVGAGNKNRAETNTFNHFSVWESELWAMRMRQSQHAKVRRPELFQEFESKGPKL